MSYVALTEASVVAHLAGIPAAAARLGGAPADWRACEVGDGNLNLVFLVTGPEGGVAAKQALPYVRLVGESWPLPLSRAYYERLALADQARWSPARVPALIHHDDDMALTVMELLRPHRTLRGALVEGERYPLLAGHLAEFLADTLFASSDLAVAVVEKKAQIAAYLGNTAMCGITEDLIFDEPFFAAPMNWHTDGLDGIVADFRADVPLRLAAQEMKARFLAAPEALLHGDLHTGSVMVTADDTRIIDPEFAFYGPIGFDVGMILANFWMAHLALPGQRPDEESDDWLLDQAEVLWAGFAERFAAHWRALDGTGGALHALALRDTALREAAIARRLGAIWQDALGFAGCEIIRRILGLAHVADFESIADARARAACERRALLLGRDLLVRRDTYADVAAVTKARARRSSPGMKIDGAQTRSIWLEADGWSVGIFDQRRLPWSVERLVLRTLEDAAVAIADMATRGAPLIGAVAAYGLALGLRDDASDLALERGLGRLRATRPTAVNLRWALERVRDAVASLAPAARAEAAYAEAAGLCDEDVAINRAIGEAGLVLLRDAAARKNGAPLNILTHCNAGWLATVDWGTATAPIYRAHDEGIPVHVWVDETRPRNQGALTAFELAAHGVPHSVIADNAGGLLMQRGDVDLVIVGTDRVTANGDVCNKIGTYLKALAAQAHGVPFYVALPSSTYDPATPDGARVEIEERSPDELRFLTGPDAHGTSHRIAVTASPARNPAFDVTPAALVTAYVTEAGVIADAAGLAGALNR